MMYNDWNSVDGIRDILVHPDMDRSKLFLAEMMRKDLLNDKWVDEWYSYKKEWLTMWRDLPYDQQLHSIIEMGFGPLSMTKNPDIYARRFCTTGTEEDRWNYIDAAASYMTYYRASLPQWKDQSTIQHWTMLHSCQLMTTFIWDLVHLIDPDGSYYVVWDGSHAYIRKDGNNVIYDILWYSVGIPIFHMEEGMKDARRYDNPIDFLTDIYLKKEDSIDILLYYMS
jgi:hypothetical protein